MIISLYLRFGGKLLSNVKISVSIMYNVFKDWGENSFSPTHSL